MSNWAIESFEIAGGFLSEINIRLPLGLTCIIGPRGSGKSTFAEALRLALSGTSNTIPKARQDFIKANLSGTVLTLTTALGTERGRFTVRRTFNQPATLTTADGRLVTTVDLDRGTFLPIDAYSSLEIEDIANESFGSKRRLLLDDLCSDEMHKIHLQLAEKRRDLEANADAIVAAQRRVLDLTERAEELGDVRSRLNAIPKVTQHEGSVEFQTASRQRQTNLSEALRIHKALDTLTGLRRTLAKIQATATEETALSQDHHPSNNERLVAQSDEVLTSTLGKAATLLADVDHLLSEGANQILAIQVNLVRVHEDQQTRYLSLQQQNLEAAQIFEARATVERELVALETIAQEKIASDQELIRLHEVRRTLRAEFLLARERISELREGVALKLQKQTSTKVRVRVLRNADSLGYQTVLAEALHGSKLKNQEHILQTLVAIRPEELAQIIRDNDLAELEAHGAFGKERARKILDTFRHNINPLTLEILPIDDSVRIELNVATSGNQNFKDAAELSRGQKCTALLPILLARRDSPLLIDQPEDNLDNHFIYETVVESIRRIKQHRQLLFITHNANIPVLGEAELVVVLNSDGNRGYVEKSGTVEQCRKEIVDLLEGGEEAFELRRRKYGTL